MTQIHSRFVLHPALIVAVIVIVVELMFFSGLMSAFIVTRVNTVIWPPPGQPRLPIEMTGINTGLLLLSLVPMRFAVSFFRAAEYRRARLCVVVAMGLGAVFLCLQGYEWVRLLEFGYTVALSVHGAFFYAIVGAHAFHVFCGVLALVFVVGRLRQEDEALYFVLRGSQWYWNFVVLLWPVLFYLVYL